MATRHWLGTETLADTETPVKTPVTITKTPSHTILQMPYMARFSMFSEKLSEFPFIRDLMVLSRKVFFGRLEVHNDASEFLPYLREYIRTEKIDCILVTLNPFVQAWVGYRLSKEFSMPLVVDFRDLWSNKYLSSSSKKTVSEKINYYISRFYMRRWLKKASLISAVTNGVLDHVRLVAPQKSTVVAANGFEKDLFQNITTYENKRKFIFSVVGSLYPHQEFDVLIQGMRKFLSDKKSDEISVEFVGVNQFPEVAQMLEKSIPKEFTSFISRVPRKDALRKMASSDVLFYIGWKGYKGIASGKIYEYLAAKRNILIAPNDNDELERILTYTNAGKLADSPEEFAQIMNEWYAEWKENGFLKYYGKEALINEFTRENQASILVGEVKKLLEK
ncbi:MAG: hypothetical protein KF685_03965 [Acidobacteria bacterium]|nr:hypothetical protein [Acidobacteriota bacterium]